MGQVSFLRTWDVIDLDKKYPTSHGIRKCITVLDPTFTSSIQSTPPHSSSLRSILILSFCLRLGLPNDFFPSDLANISFMHFSYIPYTLHVSPNSTILKLKYKSVIKVIMNWKKLRYLFTSPAIVRVPKTRGLKLFILKWKGLMTLFSLIKLHSLKWDENISVFDDWMRFWNEMTMTHFKVLSGH